MRRLNFKKLVVPMIYTLAIITSILSIYLIEQVVNGTVFRGNDENTRYVDEEIVNVDEYVPVVNMDVTVMKPYLSDNISIVKNFYDYKNPSPDGIIYYEGIYMQNTGIDYNSENSFDVVSVLDGTVINVDVNEILGNTIEIRHSNDLITLYQCVKDVKVKVDDVVLRGQTIASAGTCNLYNKSNNLHFEAYHNGLIINPQELYDRNILDLN